MKQKVKKIKERFEKNENLCRQFSGEKKYVWRIFILWNDDDDDEEKYRMGTKKNKLKKKYFYGTKNKEMYQII